MLYPLFKLHIPVLRLQLAVLWGAFLVIQFIISAVMLLLRPEESILISGTLLPFAGGFILFALTQRLVLVDFQNGVRMGRTRRKMLGLTLALIGADALLVSLSALLLPWLERTLCIRLWALLARRPGAAVMVKAPGGGQLWDPWWLAPLILLAGLLLGFLLAALTQRFGPRSYLLPSLLYLCLIFLPQAEWLRDVRLLLPAALLLAAGVAWSLWSLLHAPVRQFS